MPGELRGGRRPQVFAVRTCVDAPRSLHDTVLDRDVAVAGLKLLHADRATLSPEQTVLEAGINEVFGSRKRPCTFGLADANACNNRYLARYDESQDAGGQGEAIGRGM